MPQPVISLIIPIYNVEKFLWRTLESVQSQTWKDFEAICVNDGSSDGSADIVKKFVMSDKRFKLIDKQNGGVASARNTALGVAKGKYIMFLDGDDYLHPQAMAVAVATMVRTNADVCQFGYQEVQADEKVKMEPVLKDYLVATVSEPALEYIKNRSVPQIVIWNKIYKANLAKGQTFYPIHPGEDDVYSLQILLQTTKMVTIESVLAYYVQNPKSVMHTISEEKMSENRLIVEKYITDTLKKFVTENPHSKVCEVFRTYQTNTERMVIKSLLIKPLRQGASNMDLAQNFAKYQQRIAKGDAYLPALKYKHRLMLKLLDGQHYTLARILMWL